jgi:L-lactate dehydrogenase
MKSDKNTQSGRRVVVVGAGAVGSTYCYALAQSGLAEEIVLIDQNEELARGQVSDLVHGQPFFPTVKVRTGSAEDYTDAKLIVITAGSAQKPGETRLDLLKKNAKIVGGIAKEVAARKSKGVMLIVSNPVDALTHVAIKESGWDRSRIIGSGTVLDSARFRHFIALNCNVDVHSVHGYILGEHGDSEVAVWSMTHIGGISIENYCPLCGGCEGWEERRRTIEQQVRESAYHIINAKGSTHFAVGLALVRISAAVLRNQNSLLTVSVLTNGEYGLKDVCLSLPCVISENGIVRVAAGPLADEELKLLHKSAEVLRKAVGELGV